MRYAVVAAYAVVSLPLTWHGAVVAVEPPLGGHVFLSEHVVVVAEYSRNIESVRAGHAVVAGGAWDSTVRIFSGVPA